MLVDDEFDIEECRIAMQAYCREVVLIKNPYGRDGLVKAATPFPLAGFDHQKLRTTSGGGYPRCSRRSTRCCAPNA